MAFDECTPYPVAETIAEESMLMSMRWAERSKKAFKQKKGYGLFGIVQGSTFEKLRLNSVEALTEIGFDGYAIGGLAGGEDKESFCAVVEVCCRKLPENKPR